MSKYMIYIVPFTLDAILIATAIIGSFHYKKYKDTPLKYFLFFLWYGIFTEAMGVVLPTIFKYPNYINYNIYTLVYTLFLLWMFSKFFKNKKNIKIAQFFSGLILIFFIINTVFYENIFINFQSYIFFLASFLLIIIIILFFIEILNSDAILKIKHLLIFWIAVGVLLFQLGVIPVFIAKSYINYSQGLTYGYILLLLNLISSTCFSLGFIWYKKEIDYYN